MRNIILINVFHYQYVIIGADTHDMKAAAETLG